MLSEEFGLRSLTLRGHNRRCSVVKSLANGIQAPVAERGVRSRLGKECAMPFFDCFFVDESDHIVVDITADNLETAKRHAFVILENPASADGQPLHSIEISQRGVMVFSALGAGGLSLVTA